MNEYSQDSPSNMTDWILAGGLINDAVQDWYALTHHQPSPNQSALERLIGTDFGGPGRASNYYGPGVVAGAQSPLISIALLGLIVVGVVYVLKR